MMAQVLVLSYGEWPGIPVPLPRKYILRWCRWVHGQHCFFLNFMYGCVACIYVCACVCLVSVASKARSCCVPLALRTSCRLPDILNRAAPALLFAIPQLDTCTPSHHYWFLVSCSLCAVRHTLPSYPSSILQSCRRKAREQLWPGKQQDRKWLEWRKMLSAHL